MKNVVAVSVDDLFNFVRFREAFGVEISTPNLDRLLDMGTYFDSAYASTPVCNPSRATVLTGQSVFETGIYENVESWERFLSPQDTLPAAFHRAGYETAAVGKNFHSPNISAGYAQGVIDENLRANGLMHEKFGLPFGTGPAPAGVTDEDYVDYDMATKAAALLDGVKAGGDPLFLMAGLFHPHAPFNAPQEYFDLYPLEDIKIPGTTAARDLDLPDFAKQFMPDMGPLFDGMVEQTVQAYLAGISYSDAMLGIILDAMDRNQLWGNTTLVLWSDHGYQMGDRDLWHKFTLWEEAGNAPLIIVDPDQAEPGRVVTTPVGLNQVFPTLTDLAGINTPASVSTRSLAGLLSDDFGTYVPQPVLTYIYGSISMRSEQFRLIRYEDGSLELYNLERDPHQTVNLAALHSAGAIARTEAELARLERVAGAEGVSFHEGRLALPNGGGDDHLVAGNDVARIAGGWGDDTYFVDRSTLITENAGYGEDTIVLRDDVRPQANQLHYYMAAHVENLTLGLVTADITIHANNYANRIVTKNDSIVVYGEGGEDEITTGRGDDRVFGGTHNDFIDADQGNDRLFGGAGADLLDGGRGNDFLFSETGRDRLTGGFGADTFVFTPGVGQDNDVIANFSGPQDWTPDSRDFDVAEDRLVFRDFHFRNKAELRAAFHDTADGVMFAAEGKTVLIYGVKKAELTARNMVLQVTDDDGLVHALTGALHVDTDTGFG
ncbi:sulfatase-like hydrolase/transferase [Oceanicella sp. SM1341]|uniref:sulfatase-like hydrolase/transferase n=1 Tax=Oceanicella sp. SM1341 TaxID=1548889 RepID=UPI000E488FFC|nr:sulfatase-like hydrolase/transferase [Oceanicella sp. SM1341]